MLLSLNLNQQAVWLQQHCIPSMHVEPKPLRAASYLQLYLPAHCHSFNSICHNSCLIIK
jgi:hypothetical protein